ncbi:hypothetical protein J6TS7_03970 [Paenibacillus dendritiformis]|nr:hypothetical protein J6TS7_03970 [Paenibacillus dendritiformis]
MEQLRGDGSGWRIDPEVEFIQVTLQVLGADSVERSVQPLASLPIHRIKPAVPANTENVAVYLCLIVIVFFDMLIFEVLTSRGKQQFA